MDGRTRNRLGDLATQYHFSSNNRENWGMILYKHINSFILYLIFCFFYIFFIYNYHNSVLQKLRFPFPLVNFRNLEGEGEVTVFPLLFHHLFDLIFIGVRISLTTLHYCHDILPVDYYVFKGYAWHIHEDDIFLSRVDINLWGERFRPSHDKPWLINSYLGYSHVIFEFGFCDYFLDSLLLSVHEL